MGKWGAVALLPLIAAVGLLATAAPTRAETRLALLITNADYPSEIGALANPHKDGAVSAAALQSVGFDTQCRPRCWPAPTTSPTASFVTG
jgi:hypothetical protein